MYYDDSHEQCFFENNIEYPENLHKIHNDLPFLIEKMKIKKAEKLVANLHDNK